MSRVSQKTIIKKLERNLSTVIPELDEFNDASKNGFTQEKGRITHLRLKGLKLTEIPSEIASLPNLIELNLSDNAISDFSLVDNLHDLQELLLSGCRISKIPLLNNCKNLTGLYLWDNMISDLSNIVTLTSLESLSLEANSIEDISPLKYLTSLSFLDLGDNNIYDIKPLGNLKQLETIFINNNLIDFWPNLDLENLKELNISYNRLNQINLKKVSTLRILDINFNQFTKLPLSNLKHQLVSLSAEGNQINNIEELRNATELQTLDLDNNRIRDISPIASTRNITHLHLSGNEIIDITPLKNLDNLIILGISNNLIEDITPIKDLENITHASFQANKIKNVPYWYVENTWKTVGSANPREKGHSLLDNPIENVPIELLRESTDSIKDYLKSLENGCEAINEIKVILLGEGAAGKTSLMNFLQGNPYTAGQPQTHGINLTECINQTGVTLKIWDFGGQDIMHHTHQFFLTPKSIYVLVLNARENTDTEKWLKLIQVFGGDSPVIIVTNKIDENPSSHENVKYLSSKYPNLKNRYVRISCEKNVGLEDFAMLLTDTIKELLHVRTLWGNSWLAVKRELEEMRGGESLKDYIHFDKYEEICVKNNILKSHQDTLITWLHQLGVITYFPDPSLSETNVINPSWLTEAFYAIINSSTVAEEFGRFKINDLSKILDSSRYPKHKYSFLLGLMMKFELCYQIDDKTYLIPDLLHKEEPDFTFNIGASLKFKYKYAGLLPKAILPKFMVRRHLEIKEDKKWRTGLLIADSYFESEALIRVDEDDKEISIFVNGQERRGYLASIISVFEDINNIYEGLEYEKLVPCTCRACKHEEKPYYHKYDVLIDARNKGRKEYICQASNEDVSINDLLGILITQDELEREIRNITGRGYYNAKRNLEKGSIAEFINTLKSLFGSVSYLLFEKSEKAYHTPLFLLLRAMFTTNANADEIQSSGRADIIVNLTRYIYIFELKLDSTADEALKQIHEKQYYEPYTLEEKQIVLLGINFSSQTRNISEYKYELLPNKLKPSLFDK